MEELMEASSSNIPLDSQESLLGAPGSDRMAEDLAIEVRGADKSYGRGSKRTQVLRNYNMSIPRGKIYGLLGPSGCGKTSLLQSLVGKLRIDAGSILVFGHKPGSRNSLVPGPAVGYMPQELALYGEFTIKETLQYFGRIFNMSKEKVEERTKFLLQFLDLPRKWRLILNLSGGQQRRASLAVALLHEPKLIILDEPTVGVDPILRQTIWNHLIFISASTNATIVITTHYIEEARQAHRVGMMRAGQLLAEDSPSSLLQKLEMDSLENVFLNLCRKDGDVHKSRTTLLTVSSQQSQPTTHGKFEGRPETSPLFGGCSNMFRWHRMEALLKKNFIRMWRNLGFLIFQFIIPAVQVSLFCLAIGRDPTGMSIAVVNEEVGESTCTSYDSGCIISSNTAWVDDFEENTNSNRNFSCRFLETIDSNVINLVYFKDYDDAYATVERGENWGLIYFRQNYTEALLDRLMTMGEVIISEISGGSVTDSVSESTIFNSSVHVYLDMTNQQVGYSIQLQLGQAFKAYSESILEACNVDASTTSVPIVFESPVYGSNTPTFTEFMAPGVILSITYFMAVGLTSISFIIERREGLLDRSWIAGVTSLEVMLAHVVAQFVVMVVQVSLVLIFMILVFQVPAKGPMVWVVSLTILQGICGMAFGLVISALCDNEQDAIQLALGSFYPNLLLSGIIWPLEGMPEQLRYLSYVLPQTFACEAMRGVLSRGWGLEWEPVYRGFLITIGWTVVLLALSAVILRIRR